MKKRSFLLLIVALFVVALTIGIFSTTASAATEGCYTYTVSNGEATITYCSPSIFGYHAIHSTLVGYPVTSIGEDAFSSCFDLASITIPDGVNSIDEAAFYNCVNLTNVCYAGTKNKWNVISVGNGNEPLTNVTIHFTFVKKEGWQFEDNTWYFYENGVIVTNDWRIDSTGWCFLDEEGKWVTNGLVQDSVGLAYITDDGYFYYNTTGWKIVNNEWYYIENGYAVMNQWRQDSIGWCYLSETGAMVTNGFVEDSTGSAYITADGYFYYNVTGWKMVNGEWYYVENGYAVKNQWRSDSKGWCYLDENGLIAQNRWVNDSSGLKYLGSDGYCVKNQWVHDGYDWLYLDSNGYVVIHKLVKDSVGTLYVGEKGYPVKDRWGHDGIDWFYLKPDGYIATNQWGKESGLWTNGVKVTNYYLGSNGYPVRNQWVNDGCGWLYFGADGQPVKNTWMKDSIGWCWIDESGYWDGVYYTDIPA